MGITKQKLTNLIYKKLNGAISRASIYDAITIICDDMTEKLQNDETICIHNFGVLDTYIYHGHNGVNILSGKMEYVEPFKSVKLIPHENFMFLLNQKRNFLK